MTDEMEIKALRARITELESTVERLSENQRSQEALNKLRMDGLRVQYHFNAAVTLALVFLVLWQTVMFALGVMS